MPYQTLLGFSPTIKKRTASPKDALVKQLKVVLLKDSLLLPEELIPAHDISMEVSPPREGTSI